MSGYRLELFIPGGALPFHWAAIGKPAPGADSVIRFDFSGLVGGWPLPGGTYEARVAAVGPMGAGRSGASNPFTLEGAGCGPLVSPTVLSVPAGGGSVSVAVSAGTGCNWTTASGAWWTTVGPASGTGAGTVTLTVGPWTGTTTRTATVLVAGRTVTVSQAPVPTTCRFKLTPIWTTVEMAGATVPVSLRATAGCAWSASSPVAWLRPSPVSGTGSATVDVGVRAYSGKYPRNATVRIGGRRFEVTQLGSCAPSLSPVRLAMGAGGGTARVSVTLPSGCGWAASANRVWLSVTPGSGSVSGFVTVVATANFSTTSRRGLVTVGGRSLEVVQAGASAAPADAETGAPAASAADGADGFVYYLAERAGESAIAYSGLSAGVALANPGAEPVTARIAEASVADGAGETALEVPARAQVRVDPGVLGFAAAAGGALVVMGDGPLGVSRIPDLGGEPEATPGGAAARVLGASASWVEREPVGEAPRLRVAHPADETGTLRVAVESPDGRQVVVEPDARAARWVVAGWTLDVDGLSREKLLVTNAAFSPVTIVVTWLPEADEAATGDVRPFAEVTLKGRRTRRIDVARILPGLAGRLGALLVEVRGQVAR